MAANEIQEDIKELQNFLEQSSRTRVKDALSTQIRKWQTEVDKLMMEEQKAGENAAADSDIKPETQPQIKPLATAPAPSTYTKDLRNYAWDQSDKFMKLYVDIPGVHTIPAEDITETYTETSVKVIAAGVLNVNYQIHVAPLFSQIVPSASKLKVKTDKVLIMLKKKKEGETWAYLKEKEKKKQPTPNMAERQDPNDGLMTMLKQMYDDGDDDMKRTLAKAWTESQDKKSKGMESKGMDGMMDNL